MSGSKLELITDNIWIADGFDLHMPNRTGTYIFNEEKVTLIDTGPSISVPHIKKAITSLGKSLEDITYVIVTHVHLDHAGGAGLLLQEAPNAKLVVHPRGGKHLIDPSRLTQGARAVYGEVFDDLFEPVVPVPAEKVIQKDHEETLTLPSGRTLVFLDTPGHAKHHFSIFDKRTNGMFVGDTIGVHYVEAWKHGREIYLPSTSPNQFDPEAMTNSLSSILSYKPSRIFFGHYSASSNVENVRKQISYWLPIFVEKGKEIQQQGRNHEDLAKELIKEIKAYYKINHVEEDDLLMKAISSDMLICSMGILDYLAKQRA
ncbi:MBL fold metallo-hydrolase [Aliibacillus thermotolerans]|mgnify:FL=1|uniref:MBL fold metallo-hydrolase n=1 Tax=Aliibacillus thermotolerans TaxID=1834418 RepID=A0ABW0U668_9BACI|nr:MBL fold metallo-hydrolase [Aliibacillus thermotolerans]MDA3130140.1 MBL fold metallo-hydrolase [Aliibacillus thermotolerans]